MGNGNGNARRAPSWWMFALLALGAGGGSSILVPRIAPEIVRPEPWRSSDAVRLAKDEREWWMMKLREELKALRRELTLDLREAVIDLEATKPPLETQRRIIALESIVRRLAREHGIPWEPPTAQFAEAEVYP